LVLKNLLARSASGQAAPLWFLFSETGTILQHTFDRTAAQGHGGPVIETTVPHIVSPGTVAEVDRDAVEPWLLALTEDPVVSEEIWARVKPERSSGA
jgi:hypothetical protein